MAEKRSITIEKGRFVLDGKPFFLYSGEMHYFRIPPTLWREHLKKARLAGLNVVSSYIPWSWHEYEEGQFDFEGKSHPQRNLIRFLEMVREEGLLFSARVGPVSNAEMIGEGIPLWLLKNPDIYVRRSGFKHPPDAVLLSYLSPTFQSYVKKWYDQILPIVSDRQVHRGGQIVFVQLCNEIGMIHWLGKVYDENKYVTDMYRKFLMEKYRSIAALNQTYSSSYAGFEEVPQPKGDVKKENLIIFFDWALFYRKYYALYYNALWKMAKEHSIEVPLSANIPQFYDYDVRGRGVYSPMTTSLFRDFSEFSPGTVFGGAYQMRRLDFENFHDVGITTEVTKLLDRNVPMICAELQTGIMRDRPRLYPSDVDLNIKTSAAHGLNGVNCYMFSSGENPPGMGGFGTHHDWQAAVSLDGKEKDHFLPMKEWGRFIKKQGSALAGTKKLNDTTVGFYLPYYATEYFSGPWVGTMEFLRTNFFFDGFARLLQLAGYNFSFCDLLKEGVPELLKHKSLSVFSLDFMDEETQRKLSDYVQGGGKLLIGPKLPSINLRGDSCKILADSLGISFQESRGKEMVVWDGMECCVDLPIQTFSGKGLSLMKTVSGLSCADYGRSGAGQWIAYGFGLPHNFDYQVRIISEWFNKLQIKPHTRVEPWDVQAVVRWEGERGFLFLFNYHDVTKKGKVKLTLNAPGKPPAPFTKTFSMQRRSACVISLALRKNRITEVKK